MKNFKEKCPESYQLKGLCHSYFFKEFNLYPSILHIEKKEYLNKIREFHDPILTYVALYLYRNYAIAQKYFETKTTDPSTLTEPTTSTEGKTFKALLPKTSNNAACAVLNRWLDQQKSFYTNFGKCSYNRRWWNIYIESLWKELEKYYPNRTCERFDLYYDHYYNVYYDQSKIQKYQTKNDKSYQLIPEDYVCFKQVDEEKYKHENCAKLSILFYLGERYKLLDENSNPSPQENNKYCPADPKNYEKINYNPVLKAEKSHFCKSLTSTISLPIIVTVLGTIFLAFFLNEFTPMGSILRTSSKNKLTLPEQFNEEPGYEEYKTYRNNNRNKTREKNIIYYQSTNE